MLFAIAISLIIGSAVTAPVVANLPIFTPASFSLDSHQISNKFKIHLTSQPTKDVICYVGAKGLTFDACSYKIPFTHWSEGAEVTYSGVPVFTDRVQDSFNITVQCDNNPSQVHQYPGSRIYSKGASCTSNGDPHVTTFNGKYFTHMGLGAYHMIDSADLEVQTLQGLCNGKDTTCNKAVSIRYGTSVFLMDSPDTNSNTSYFTNITPNVHGVVFKKEMPKDSTEPTYTFKLPGGHSLVVSMHFQLPYKHYFNVALQMAHAPAWYGGICNQIAPANNLFQLRNGTMVNNTSAFYSSWAVPSHRNMFSSDYVVTATAPKENGALQSCSLPSNVPAARTNNQCKLRPASNTSLQRRDVSTMSDTEYATAYCGLMLSGCDDIISRQNLAGLVSSCADDIILTNDFSFADGHQQGFQAYCQSLTNMLNEDVHDINVERSLNIQQELGFGTFSCPGNGECYGHGTCSSSGCNCDSGFVGTDCSIPTE